MGLPNEADHLLQFTEQQRESTEDRIIQLHQQERTTRQIAAETGRPYTTVFRLVKKLGGESKHIRSVTNCNC